jgi:uncharacterized protein (DUF302 family)
MSDGLITVDSPLNFQGTLAFLEAALTNRGATIFAKIDHAANALGVGLELGPTTVLIYGNAMAGTKLMQIDQRAGLDLPLKLLVWTHAGGLTRVTYSDPVWVAARFGIKPDAARVLNAMQGMVKGLLEELVKAQP